MPDCLSLDEQDKLFEILSFGTISGYACSIAGYIWGGVSLDDKLTWGDVRFDADDPSLAVIQLNRIDTVGATHDYSRPIFPACAIIWHMRYRNLLTQYSEEELKNAPIFSIQTDPFREMSNEAFLAAANRILKELPIQEGMLKASKKGASAATKRIFRNTYIRNVYHRIGLYGDRGTAAFLCGESLSGDVTSDNYTKFNDEDGIERIHAAQMFLYPLMKIKETAREEIFPDGVINYTYSPDNTRKTVGVGCDIILPPGSEIVVMCPHGVDAVIKGRTLKEDGTALRKGGKTKKASKKQIQSRLIRPKPMCRTQRLLRCQTKRLQSFSLRRRRNRAMNSLLPKQ